MGLAAPFFDYAGVPRSAGIGSPSPRPVLEKKSSRHREVVRSGLNRWRTVRDREYKLVRGFDPAAKGRETQAGAAEAPPMLFNLLDDPLENRNIAAKAPD